MKRNEIKIEIARGLKALGFTRSSCTELARGGDLIVLIGGALRTFKFKAGISKRAFAYEMGRIAGLAEAYGIPA